ncbi:hypothetical protein EC968_001958 [Mortierella alpina]|nr:hypothetical protein EC968_001958 [Mortierella alpina]
MTEEHPALHHEENWEYEEDEDNAEEYDEDDEEYDDKDDSIEVGDEIALVYHSKEKPEAKALKSIATHGKSNAAEGEAACPPAKRTKLGHSQGLSSSNHDPDTAVAMGTEPGSAPSSKDKGAPMARVQPAQKTTEFSVTERKPSFRKADKVSLNHHKDQWQDSGKQKGSKSSSTRQTPATLKAKAGATPSKSAAAVASPPIDAATIAYYQSLGYYYDPLHGSTGQASDTPADEQEQSNNVTPTSKTRAKNGQSTPSLSTAQPGPFDFGATPSISAHYPYHPHGVYAGYPSNIPAGATSASATGGGYTMTGAPGTSHPWMAFGAGDGAMPVPFAQGFAAPGAAPRYPLPMGMGMGMGMGMVPPPNLSHPVPPLSQQAGQFSASGMDEEALNSLPHTTMFEQKSQRLMAACAEGNLELVNRIASKFESPEELCEAEPSTGYTPLMMAARHGHLDVVEALIRLGHDSTEISRDPLNNNVLMVTAEHGHLAVFELYANKFPRSVQMSNKLGWSPLTAAARYGVTSMVEMVLNLGADLNHRDEEGSTALHHAAAYGHLQTITVLIERGSSATIKNNGGWTAVDFAYSDKVSAHMEDCWRSLGRSLTSSPSSFSSLYSASGQDPTQNTLSVSPTTLSLSNGMPTPLSSAGRKESWASLSNGPLSPILATISGATSPRLMPSNAWSEFKRVVVKQQLH